MVTKPKIVKQHPRIAAPILKRAAVFLVVFIFISGILGPKIISHGLVNKYGFEIYGGAGKALLFSIVALAILVGRKLNSVKLPKWQSYNLVWFAISLVLVIFAWLGIDKLIANQQTSLWAVLTNLCLLASIILALGGSFGPASLRQIVKTFKRELLITLILAIAFLGFLYAIYNLWQVLSTAVLHAVKWLLGMVGLHAIFIPPRTLLFNKFGIDVAEYCSGIESIALFTALYALIGVLDYHKLNLKKYYLSFLPALILLFGFNILRVAGLILAGYYINPHIAFSLFHTYAGMIFFIIYSLIFWGISYKWMLGK